MSVATGTKKSELTAYEREQVRRIAAWKAEPPNALAELWKRISLPVARLVEKLLPDSLVRVAITKAYDVSELLAGQEAIRRRAGVKDLGELGQKPLKTCDELSIGVGISAEALGLVEGAATGAGGVITTLLDIPLIFVLSVATIRRIGHCYGYSLEHHKDRHFVLGVLIAAMAGTLEVRQERVHKLRELEDLLIEETQEEIISEEMLSFLFHLEIFEEIPAIGAISGAVLNGLFIRRVVVTARMVFEERWLHDNGKVDWIEPAQVPSRYGTGWAGALGRLAYSGCYGLGFGVALPVYAAATLLRPMDNALVRGLRDGASAANEQAEKLAARDRAASATPVNGRNPAPALAPG